MGRQNYSSVLADAENAPGQRLAVAMPGSGAKLRAHTWPGAGGTVVDPDGRLYCWSFSIPPSQTFPVPFPETTPHPVGDLGGVREFTGSTDGLGQLSLPSKGGDRKKQSTSHLPLFSCSFFYSLLSS